MKVDSELYVTNKAGKVKTGYYRQLKYGYVYADFIVYSVGKYILEQNPDLDFVMVITDDIAYLYSSKDYIRVESIASDFGGKCNAFKIREQPRFFVHKKLFRVSFLGYDSNTYYKDVEGEDRAEAEYNFHKHNYGEIVKCEFIKYVD